MDSTSSQRSNSASILLPIVVAAIYGVANVAAILLIEFPLLGMYFFWGFVGPLAAIAAYGIWLRKRLGHTRRWIITWFLITGCFVALGYWSLHRITSLWAGV